MIKTPIVQPYSQKTTTVQDPKIFFGVDINGYDQNIFPTYDDHYNKYACLKKEAINGKGLPISQIFRKSIQQCQNRIWILDRYLHESDYRKKLVTILDEIVLVNSNLNVRFYLSLNDDREIIQTLFTDKNHDIQQLKERSNNVTTIESVFIKDLSWLHDRFAILDDTLWHFGSDVGSSNKSLHATSYGWDAGRAIDFFNKLWENNRR